MVSNMAYKHVYMHTIANEVLIVLMCDKYYLRDTQIYHSLITL